MLLAHETSCQHRCEGIHLHISCAQPDLRSDVIDILTVHANACVSDKMNAHSSIVVLQSNTHRQFSSIYIAYAATTSYW
jgi:hypothetical protein